jgi:hypothetical protein
MGKIWALQADEKPQVSREKAQSLVPSPFSLAGDTLSATC